jgi:hypothetical protein
MGGGGENMGYVPVVHPAGLRTLRIKEKMPNIDHTNRLKVNVTRRSNLLPADLVGAAVFIYIAISYESMSAKCRQISRLGSLLGKSIVANGI